MSTPDSLAPASPRHHSTCLELAFRLPFTLPTLYIVPSVYPKENIIYYQNWSGVRSESVKQLFFCQEKSKRNLKKSYHPKCDQKEILLMVPADVHWENASSSSSTPASKSETSWDLPLWWCTQDAMILFFYTTFMISFLVSAWVTLFSSSSLPFGTRFRSRTAGMARTRMNK